MTNVNFTDDWTKKHRQDFENLLNSGEGPYSATFTLPFGPSINLVHPRTQGSSINLNYPQNWAQMNPSRKEKTKTDRKNQIFVPLKNCKRENIQVSINKLGLVTISATFIREIKDTGRNGNRKITTIIEENLQLPKYLIENKDDNGKMLLESVSSKFAGDNGGLLFTLPEDPAEVEKPVDVEINFNLD